MALEVSTNRGLCQKLILFQWEELSLRRVVGFLFGEGELLEGGREWGRAETAAPKVGMVNSGVSRKRRVAASVDPILDKLYYCYS